MHELDLSGVDPLRHAEVRRRVSLVVDYLAGPRTAVRREAAAAELGVTPGQFLRLARTWRETGSPARLYGARPTNARRRPARSIDPAAEVAISEAIDSLGVSSRFTDVFADVSHRCEAVGVPVPAGSTVYDRLNRRRSTTGVREGEPSITLVRCALRLPVEQAGAIVRPVALLAVAMPEGLVAAAEIGIDDVREPDLARLVRRLLRNAVGEAPIRPLVAQPSLLGGGAGIESVIADVPIRGEPAAARIVSTVFGQKLGSLGIATASRSDRRYRASAVARLNQPPTLVAATALLMTAIRKHNAARSDKGLPSFSLHRVG